MDTIEKELLLKIAKSLEVIEEAAREYLNSLPPYQYTNAQGNTVSVTRVRYDPQLHGPLSVPNGGS